MGKTADMEWTATGSTSVCAPSSQTFIYETTYKRLYKPMHRYGMHLLNDAFTIDNVVQEAFLKLWEYRQRISCYEHAKRFLRQQVRWECHAYFRSPVSRFHRRFTYLDGIEDYDTLFGLCELEDDTEQDAIELAQLKAITDMIPFLPSGRDKTYLQRYYLDGLSRKQIAVLYGISVNAVNVRIVRATAQLRSMIVRPQYLFGTTHTSSSLRTDTNQRIWLYDIAGLTKEQSQIYRLRKELGYEFARIAVYLDLPQAYVQREYVKAWKVVSGQKREKETGNRWPHRPMQGSPEVSRPVTFLIA